MKFLLALIIYLNFFHEFKFENNFKRQTSKTEYYLKWVLTDPLLPLLLSVPNPDQIQVKWYKHSDKEFVEDQSDFEENYLSSDTSDESFLHIINYDIAKHSQLSSYEARSTETGTKLDHKLFTLVYLKSHLIDVIETENDFSVFCNISMLIPKNDANVNDINLKLIEKYSKLKIGLTNQMKKRSIESKFDKLYRVKRVVHNFLDINLNIGPISFPKTDIFNKDYIKDNNVSCGLDLFEKELDGKNVLTYQTSIFRSVNNYVPTLKKLDEQPNEKPTTKSKTTIKIPEKIESLSLKKRHFYEQKNPILYKHKWITNQTHFPIRLESQIKIDADFKWFKLSENLFIDEIDKSDQIYSYKQDDKLISLDILKYDHKTHNELSAYAQKAIGYRTESYQYEDIYTLFYLKSHTLSLIQTEKGSTAYCNISVLIPYYDQISLTQNHGLILKNMNLKLRLSNNRKKISNNKINHFQQNHRVKRYNSKFLIYDYTEGPIYLVKSSIKNQEILNCKLELFEENRVVYTKCLEEPKEVELSNEGEKSDEDELKEI
ncbi:unnamed protein product [Brachionus calyciflorus]|uniref:Uncharacterized protein n=1 Tax=Brachionus calyciflorus TaxID=104777 RepID=A0A813W4P4_9BILA|nr:unnamed protein product [Brachionus calyciflorus]